MPALAAVVGLLIGSIPSADAVARARGIDLRAGGSGNPGLSVKFAIDLRRPSRR